MRCPRLHELPPSPPGKTGWPWTEDSTPLQDVMPDGQEWPRISIVTPSFNHGQYIEETIRSILLQGYPNLEYLLIDGGSTDNSVEVIKKYSPWLSYWVSEPDGGQSDAINRGLKKATGEFATWINSDDLLCKNALVEHARRIGFEKNTVYLGFCIYLDQDCHPVSVHRGKVFSLEDLLRVKTIWRSGGRIVQPEVLFPRALALKVGGLETDNHCTMDYELWGKFFLAGAKFHYTDIEFGMFRRHPIQKTQDGLRVTRSLLDTAKKLVFLAENLSSETKNEIVADLDAYSKTYQVEQWKMTGRLARIGLPARIVSPLRNVNAKLQRMATRLFF
jgi:glycosyltransferase involved in cell wall biosynthesis